MVILTKTLLSGITLLVSLMIATPFHFGLTDEEKEIYSQFEIDWLQIKINETKINDSKFPIINLNSFENGDLYVSLDIGNPSQHVKALLTSTNSRRWVMSQSCNDCHAPDKFNENYSRSFSIEDNNQKSINFTHAGLTGPLGHDQFKLSNVFSTEKQSFVLVKSSWRLDSFNAITSFPLSFPGEFFPTEKNKKPIIGLHLDTYSNLCYGGYNPLEVKNETNIQWTTAYLNNTLISSHTSHNKISQETRNKFEWYFKIGSLSIGNYHKTDIEATIDITSSDLAIPYKDFFEIKDKILGNKANCQVQPSGYFICRCEKDYKKQFKSFTFSNPRMDYEPEDYLESIDESKCRLSITINYETNAWIFGRNSLSNYYLIFDYQESRLGVYSMREENEDDKFRKMIIFIVLITIITSVGFFSFLFYLYKKSINNANIQDDQRNI